MALRALDAPITGRPEGQPVLARYNVQVHDHGCPDYKLSQKGQRVYLGTGQDHSDYKLPQRGNLSTSVLANDAPITGCPKGQPVSLDNGHTGREPRPQITLKGNLAGDNRLP